MRFVGLVVRGNVDELEDERSSSNDATASWKEIPTDNVFQDGGFARGL